MALRFFALRPRFLLREVSRGDGPGALASVLILSVKTSRPGSTTGAFLQSMPHGHRNTNTGPGSVAPWPRLGITYAQAFSKKEQYQNNGNITMIDNDNTNTPPWGPHIAVFLRRKREKWEQIRQSSPRAGPELPSELKRTPSRASPGCDGGRTRYHPPSRHDGAEADRGRC